MTALVLGLVLFLVPHSLRAAAPGLRAGLVATLGAAAYKAVYSLVTAAGLVLIVWGFGRAWQDPQFVYAAPAWGRHVAMALMIPALVLAMASAFPPGRISRAVGHPLLTATMLWAIAHLLANGDLAGVVLFSVFLVWAAVDRILQPDIRVAPAVTGSIRADVAAIFASLALYVALVAGLHLWLFGASPVA